MTDINPDSLYNLTPEDIAQVLFSQDPKEPFIYKIVAEKELADSLYIFEILMIILMEGLDILTGDLSKANLANLTCDHIMALNPWFHSLCFTIKSVEQYELKNDEPEYKDYYCKVVPKDKLHEVFFNMKNIEKHYHFFLNGEILQKNNDETELCELHSVFLNDNVIFKIIFDFLDPNNIDQQK